MSSTYVYDPASHLLSITHSGGAGVNIPLTYTYDPVGNRSLESTSVGEALTTASAASTFNQDNQLTTSNGPSGATSYSYDVNGNLTSAATPNGTTTYTWDTRNRLRTISQPNGQSTSLLYGSGRSLLQQTDSGPTLNSTRTFILDQFTNPVFIATSTGDNLSVLNGLGIDQDLAIINTSGAVEYGLKDAINSTVGTIDQNGAAKGTFVYEPFGQTTASNTTYPFQFTGRMAAVYNLYYYRARFYNSQTGRFVSEAPFDYYAGI